MRISARLCRRAFYALAHHLDTMHEESFVESCRCEVERQYSQTRLASGSVGGCFGSILCSELHHGLDGKGLHFTALAEKWGIPVSLLGELIWDHCKRLEPMIRVNHAIIYQGDCSGHIADDHQCQQLGS